ncbi:hypothetical protein HXX76_012460 [Chlamydomonas incerta]|uniref:Flavin-containing monooxygenase n=1 Tax=Chlamydomonas incerta TaxID=51695 RepID=A0A835SS47_CHLIN|nr:hypothetical protein HXX76_012460 [Chlamydomonas incerta]|eukprot:KAG2427264.1 hypothetical protein HXX76_012460 [Chlamydomonas incerta]
MAPTLFDRRHATGGMWNPERSGMYDSLHTNVSRYSCVFSDFPWPEGAPDFPTPAELGAYLSAYRAAFLPPAKCPALMGVEVLRVERAAAAAAARPGAAAAAAQGGAWRVQWRALPPDHDHDPQQQQPQQQQPTELTEEVQAAEFDAVIVASGYAAVPALPDIPGLEGFAGRVVHSLHYRNAADFDGLRVAVIGAGHSALDIASDLALASAACAPAAAAGGGAGGPASVVHVFPRPMWVTPRYLPDSAAAAGSGGGAAAAPAPFLPLDMQFYRRSRRAGPEEVATPHAAQRQKGNGFWASMCGDQAARISPLHAIPPDAADPPVIGICDAYVPLAATGAMALRRARLTRVTGPATLELSDGGPPLSDIDALVLATGIKPDLSYLPDDVLAALSYTPHDNYLPVAAHRGVTHPDVPGLALVGLYRGTYFGAVELQARLAAAALSGLAPPEPEAVVRAGVAAELAIRDQAPRPVLPHGDYVGHTGGLAAALGVLPDAGWRAGHDQVLPGDFGLLPPPWEAAAQAVAAEAAEAAVAVGRPAAAYAAAAAAVAESHASLAGFASGRMVARAVFYALAGAWRLHRGIVSCMASSPSGVVTGTASFRPVRMEAAAATAAAAGDGSSSGSSSSSSRARAGSMPFQYLYREQGQFAIQGSSSGGGSSAGAVMRVSKEYVYRYDSPADRLDVFFADAHGVPGGFFHSLRFLAPGEAAPGPHHFQPEEGPAAAQAVATDGAAAGGAAAASGGDDGDGGCWRAVGEHLCVRDMYYSSYRFWFQGVHLRKFQIQFVVKGPNKDYTSTATYTRP